MPGRDLQWLPAGSEKMSLLVMTCPAKSVVRPLHSHKGVEEILFILEGEGEAWVDGATGRFKTGDTVLFPADSKHQVRNVGESELIAVCIFSDTNAQDSYVNHDSDVF
jgi:quercetin dioxygenase-like cupin family protein